MFVEACKTNKNIKIAIIDHISSCSAIKFPVKKIIEALKPFNILILIDGAHAPGQIPSLDLGKVRFTLQYRIVVKCTLSFLGPKSSPDVLNRYHTFIIFGEKIHPVRLLNTMCLLNLDFSSQFFWIFPPKLPKFSSF